jgi:hypothetical protein
VIEIPDYEAQGIQRDRVKSYTVNGIVENEIMEVQKTSSPLSYISTLSFIDLIRHLVGIDTEASLFHTPVVGNFTIRLARPSFSFPNYSNYANQKTPIHLNV